MANLNSRSDFMDDTEMLQIVEKMIVDKLKPINEKLEELEKRLEEVEDILASVPDDVIKP